MSNSLVTSLWAATTTTLVNPHRGVALPAARVVVVAIPTAVALFYLLVVRRRK